MPNSNVGRATKQHPRRVQSAKSRPCCSENTGQAIIKAKFVTKPRPASATATSTIEPNVYGYGSGKTFGGPSDTSNFSLEPVTSALPNDATSSQYKFQTHHDKQKCEMYDILDLNNVTIYIQ